MCSWLMPASGPSPFFITMDMSDFHSNPGHLIPEVLLNIGLFLGQRSLASSVRVCRLWHQALEPLVYRTIDPLRPLPPVEVLQKHLSDIHTISLEGRDPEMRNDESRQQLYLCRNLRTLDLILHEWYDSEDCPELGLIATNCLLSRLTIKDETSMPSRPWGWAFSQSHPILQQLLLTFVSLDADATEHLLKIAQSLTELKLVHCRIAALDVKASPQFMNLKVLFIKDVFDSPDRELDWISHCPRLETLQWTSEWREDAEHIFQEIRLLRWPHLCSLELIWGTRQFLDIEVAAMLDACDHLRSFSACGSKFWYRSLKSLERHLDTLERLDLSECPGATSWMLHWILTRSSRLKSFSAECIQIHELIMDCPHAETIILFEILKENEIIMDYLSTEEAGTLVGPQFQEIQDELRPIIKERKIARTWVHAEQWICLDLEEFICPIIHGPNTLDAWNFQVLGRFSALTHLRRLELGVKVFSPAELTLQYIPESCGLRLDLKSGLGQLDTLTCLQSLKFERTKQNLWEEDCQWMLDHWPALGEVSCDFNDDDNSCEQLRDMMYDHRVYSIKESDGGYDMTL